MRYFIAIIIAIPFTCLTQVQSGIKHFQRKAVSLNVFPGELFVSTDFLIPYPDSMFNFGEISVNKIKYEKFICKDYKLVFDSDTVTSIQFKLRNLKSVFIFTEQFKLKPMCFPISELEFSEEIICESEVNKFTLIINKEKKGYRVLFKKNK